MEENTNISWIKLIQDAGLEQQFIEAARANGVEATEDTGKIFYEKVCKGGELSDEELDNVAGGCGGTESPEEVLERHRRLQLAESGVCPKCGAVGTLFNSTDLSTVSGDVEPVWACRSCNMRLYKADGNYRLYQSIFKK